MSSASFASIIDLLDWNNIASSPVSLAPLASNSINWVDIQMNLDAIGFVGYDYVKIKRDNEWIKRELVECLFHPKRIQRWLESGLELEDYLN